MPIYSWHTRECPDSYREWCVLPINRDKLSDNNVKNNKQIAFFKQNVSFLKNFSLFICLIKKKCYFCVRKQTDKFFIIKV